MTTAHKSELFCNLTHIDTDIIKLNARINAELESTESSTDLIRIALRHLLVLSYVDHDLVPTWRHLSQFENLESYSSLLQDKECPLSDALYHLLRGLKPSVAMKILTEVIDAYTVINSHTLRARDCVVAKFLFEEVYGNPKKESDGVAVSTIIDRVSSLVTIAIAQGILYNPLLIGLATPTKTSTPMAYKQALEENDFEPLVVQALTPILQLDLIDWWSLQIYLDSFVVTRAPEEHRLKGAKIRAMGYISPHRTASVASIFQGPIIAYQDLDDDDLLT